MNVDKSLVPELALLEKSEIFTHGHLPVAAAFCRRLGLVEAINTMVPSQMQTSPGLVVQAMVLDVLSGRTPLYRLEDFMAGQDVELLLGQSIASHAFNDTNLSRCLDALFDAGTSKIVTELGRRAVVAFGLDTSVASYDTTSTSVWGEYRACEGDAPPPGPVVTYGHSKDALPHLKQFMTELLCVDRGVPIFGQTRNGNSSDKTSNNELLTRISSIMARHGLGAGAFVYAADSAMVTKSNLEAIGDVLFVSRLPATYGECARAIAAAVDIGQWVSIGALAENADASPSRPAAVYRCHETTVDLHGKTYRALVVHSSSHDARRQKKLDKALAQSAKVLQAAFKPFEKIYFCEEDAQEAARQAQSLSDRMHAVAAALRPVQVRKRGRPPKQGPAPTHTRYELTCSLKINQDEVDRVRALAGCFVLLSNVPIEGEQAMDSKQLLKTYKGQYGVESDFAFLKDPLVVNDLFLKTPARIEALGMVLILALLVWRLMERSMRVHVQNTQAALPGWDRKPTMKPTAFMMSTKIVSIQVALIAGRRFLLKNLATAQLAFLKAMGTGPAAFLDPSYRCQPIIPAKSDFSG
ncbi:MAG: IS1634 family transposase [Desulfomonilia bacterium]|jgi:transposase